MARREIQGFVCLRPHQRPAWHMFLVQFGALVLWNGDQDDFPVEENDWKLLIRKLTPDFGDDAPWRLVVSDRRKPAFMQPPDPGSLKWTSVATPDEMDMLITSRNHDLKQQVAKQATFQDWVYALVSLQTMEGYLGPGYNGIARMNGGASSRPLLGLVPAGRQEHVVDVSGWWQRDVGLLLENRTREGESERPCVVGGKSLLWLYDWPQNDGKLDPRSLDPWFIEVCRRIRLINSENGLQAEKTTSKGTRINAREFKGVLYEPWGPVHKAENKLLTLGKQDFSYQLLYRILYSGDWGIPLLANSADCDQDDMVLVAESFSRGKSKTYGFKSRLIPIPKTVVRNVFVTQARDIAKEQIEDINVMIQALFCGFVVMSAGGKKDENTNKFLWREQDEATANVALKAFKRQVDSLFFPGLWEQLSVAEDCKEKRVVARKNFIRQLLKEARFEFDAALPGISCASIHRPRAEARARRAFESRHKSLTYEKTINDAA